MFYFNFIIFGCNRIFGQSYVTFIYTSFVNIECNSSYVNVIVIVIVIAIFMVIAIVIVIVICEVCIIEKVGHFAMNLTQTYQISMESVDEV